MKKTAPYRVKSHEWAYEVEWRVVATLSGCNKQVPLTTDVIHLYRFNAKSLRRVVLGQRMSHEDRDRVLGAIKSNPDLGHVLIDRAEIDINVFRLNYVRGVYPRRASP